MPNDTRKFVAAVDLGSNSFHMKVAQIIDGRIHVVDRLKEMVRLAGGLDEDNVLSVDAEERALACLGRFGQRLREVPPENVRVVGTNTLRRAKRATAFLARATEAIGHRIEIISGIEEARLIYLGVAHNASQQGGQRLVIDIGGGSTEVIIGREFMPLHLESLYMGCVGFSQRFFPGGRITEARMERATLAALQELEPLQVPYRRVGWDEVLGSSGTIIGIAEVIRHKGGDGRAISPGGLDEVRAALLAAGHVEKLNLPGLQPERAAVFPGGVAILCAAFAALGIKRMERSDGALREGLLYDLLGRLGPEDVREETIRQLMSRYRIDSEQATRVARTATALYMQVATAWKIDGEQHLDLLRWAALLHEIGFAIAHSQHHKHGAYLLEHADLPGFSRDEQTLLGAMVRAHRRKFPFQVIEDLPIRRARALSLAVLLRIAVVLNRARSDDMGPDPRAIADGDTLQLAFSVGWLDAHPLTRVDLEQEADYLKETGIKLEFS